MAPIFFKFNDVVSTPTTTDKIKYLAIEVKGIQGEALDAFIYHLEIYDGLGTIVPMSNMLNAYNGKIDSANLTAQYPFTTLSLTDLLSTNESDAVHLTDPTCDYSYIVIEFDNPIEVSKVRFKAKVTNSTGAYGVRFFKVYPFVITDPINMNNFTQILSSYSIPADGKFHFIPLENENQPPNKYKTAKSVTIWVSSENDLGISLVYGAVTFYDEYGNNINSEIKNVYQVYSDTKTDSMIDVSKIGDNQDVGMIHNVGGYSIIPKVKDRNYAGYTFNFKNEVNLMSISFKLKTVDIIDANWKHYVTIGSYDNFINDFNSSISDVKKSNISVWEDIPNVMLSSESYAYFDIRYFASKIKGYFN